MKIKKVATEGGTRPINRMFGAMSAGILIAFIVIITTKNEISKITLKNIALPSI